MGPFKVFAMVMALFVSGLVSADNIKIKIPEQLKIISVNDVAYTDNSNGKETVLSVSPGNAKLVVQYHDMVKNSEGEFEKVRSRDLIIVVEAEAGFSYRIETPRPKSVSAARAFSNNPTFNVFKVNPSGEEETAQSSEQDKMAALKAMWQTMSATQRADFLDWVSNQ
ncbi:DUF2057 family protein [Pleionea litopenaei]|uniref:DUF2057 family protein n=1 Tax=Pleionea litopenaei TaxID=3070815 RepID=A0AA51RUR6_9GAMM|nr:DUF2057 family protein [Pleionea sp. HL-JVS1]WMS87977.1 DUF2057 family protein [Pleionea sp. HL-JVS1]